MEIKLFMKNLLKVTVSLGILFVFTSQVQGSVYTQNCIACHKEIPVSIDKYFYRYLLKYSSEKKVKHAIKHYLQNPSQEKTVMADAFINRFGIKNKSKLSDKDLENAINEYWQTFKIFGKLK